MTDDQFREFFTHLSAAPDVSDAFIRQCWMREVAGREAFGDQYLNRDNCLEGKEEASDGANYAAMEHLRREHLSLSDQLSLALEAAHHFAQAHAKLAQLRNCE